MLHLGYYRHAPTFPRSCKIAKVKPVFKKGLRDQFSKLPPFLTSPLVNDQTEGFLSKQKFYTDFNGVSKKITLQSLVLDI